MVPRFWASSSAFMPIPESDTESVELSVPSKSMSIRGTNGKPL